MFAFQGYVRMPQSSPVLHAVAAVLICLTCVCTGIAQEKRLQGHQKPVTSVLFVDNSSKLISASEDGAVRIWKIDTNTDSELLYKVDSRVACMTLGSDGILLSGTDNGEVIVWSVKQQRRLRSFRAHVNTTRVTTVEGTVISESESSSPLLSIGVSSDGKFIATASSDKTVGVWDMNGKGLHRLVGHTDSVNGVLFSQDNKIVISGGSDRTIRTWDMSTGKIKSIHKRHASDDLDAGISAMALLPGKSALATCGRMSQLFGDYTIRLWDIETGTNQEMTRLPDGAGTCVASNDEHIVFGTSNGQVHLWRRHATDKKPEYKFVKSWNITKISNAVTAIALSKDSKAVAVGGSDNDVIVISP
jgi:WD40 repeat protein